MKHAMKHFPTVMPANVGAQMVLVCSDGRNYLHLFNGFYNQSIAGMMCSTVEKQVPEWRVTVAVCKAK